MTLSFCCSPHAGKAVEQASVSLVSLAPRETVKKQLADRIVVLSAHNGLWFEE
jgi:hypothetical protein